jgi:hypothetical protein
MPDAEGLPVGTLVIDAFMGPAIIILESLGMVDRSGKPVVGRGSFAFRIVVVNWDHSVKFCPYWCFGRANIEDAKLSGRIIIPGERFNLAPTGKD